MNSIDLARQIRRDVLTMCHRAKTAHAASCLSCADILAVWYAEPRETPLIVSKGHAAAALYSALARTGHFDPAELEGFGQPGRLLECTHVSATVPGVVHSSGSLGHGLPVACGMALADPQRGAAVLISDAELQCGTTWEAALFAAARLLPITVLVDDNRWQALGPTDEVLGFRDFPVLKCHEADGHDHDEMRRWFASALSRPAPRVLNCNTLKGRGVSFMEDDPITWHYKAPDAVELAAALAEIDR